MPFSWLQINIEQLLPFLILIGTGVFAVSGALAGLRQQLDFIGVAFVAIVTGIGGGTLRDLFLGLTPVGWVNNPIEVFICIFCALIVCLLNKHLLGKRLHWLYIADAMGLALFAVLGAATAQEAGADPFICILFGAMSASFGGIIRDIICNETPVFLQREIYITAALVGAAIYIYLPEDMSFSIKVSLGIATAFILRWLAMKYNWSLGFPKQPQP